MDSDDSNSDASSDREKKTHRSRTSGGGGKSGEKKKKHEKHKKHKKAKKHKKHRHHHLSDAESEGKSDDDGSDSSSGQQRKRAQRQPSPPERPSVREREPTQLERVRQDREPKQQTAASRWDSPGEGEGRHLSSSSSQRYDHSKSHRTKPSQSDARGEHNPQQQQHDERYHRDSNRRRYPPPVARSPPPTAGEYRERRRRYSDEDHRRGGERYGQQEPFPSRHDDHYGRGNRNGRGMEHRDGSPMHQNSRYEDRRPRRNDSYADYHEGGRGGGGGGGGRGARRGGHDNSEGYHQRRYSSPSSQSYRGQQQRDRARIAGQSDEREYRNERPQRGSYGGGSNRHSWQGHPHDRDRDRNRPEEREREGGERRPAEIKVERETVSPGNPVRGRSRSPDHRGESRSTTTTSHNGRGQRRREPPSRSFNESNEEQQFEWGRRETDPGQPRKPHAPRMIKGEEEEEDGRRRRPIKKEEPGSDPESAPPEKEKPNFALSGKLTEEANKVNGTVIAYAEPPGARKPKRRWRLYPFKGEQALPTLYIHRQSCYLIGRDRKVCDLPVDHPSCSKQHAVLQYRLMPYQREDGTTSQRVRPYIIDLESANGTFVNNEKIEPKRYVELLEKDVLKFGFSSREYVVLHENSKEDKEDDDVCDMSPGAKPGNGAGNVAAK